MEVRIEFLKLINKIKSLKLFTAANKFKFNISELIVVSRLLEAEGAGTAVNMSDLAKELSISKPAVSQMVTKMERKKLIRRQANKQDRKIVNLVLTDKGHKMYESERENHLSFIDAIYHEMGDDLKRFIEYTNRLIDLVGTIGAKSAKRPCLSAAVPGNSTEDALADIHENVQNEPAEAGPEDPQP